MFYLFAQPGGAHSRKQQVHWLLAESSMGEQMRSEYVFAATKEISNRFLLCRMAAVSARRLQMGSKQPSETINQSLRLIATAEVTEQNCKGASSEACPPVAPAVEVGTS
jgi:DNA-directed RNA polymerase subunit K/omega